MFGEDGRMKNEFVLAFNEVLEDKGLPREVVLEALSTAMVSAYRKAVNASTAQQVDAKIDSETGRVTIFAEKEVVDDVQDVRTEVALEDARKIDPAVELGGMVMVESTPKDFGRVAAQTARQVIQQRIREAERDTQMRHYAKQVGDIVSGVVQAVAPQQVTLGLDMKAEGILPYTQQIKGERFHVHDRVQSLLLEVKQSPRGPQIILSRAHRNFLRRLLENEVPEIYHGLVEIRSIAREPGQRSKVAVAALQPAVDPVGACVGIRGVRIQAIVRELHDEKIDVIEFDSDPASYIAKALSPARVTGVYLNEHAKGTKTATVVVMEDQLSLAIGRDGQNARLAAKLTGWRIDIKSLVEAAADALHRLQTDADYSFLAASEADNLPRVEAVLAKKAEGRPITPEEFTVISQFVDRIERGLIYRRTAEKRQEEERRKAARSHVPEPAFTMTLEDLGLGERVYDLLTSTGYETVGDLMMQIELDEDAVLGISGIGPKAMEDIHQRLTNLVFPDDKVSEPGEAVPTAEEPAEAAVEIATVEEMVKTAEPELPIVDIVQLPSVEAEISEPTVLSDLGAPAVEKTPVEVPGVEVSGADGGHPQPGELDTQVKSSDFDELFSLKPGEIGYNVTGEDEEEEDDADQKPGAKKGKKKKKRFVEVVYDPDRDVTLVKRKRKRDGAWGDEWEA
jgi:N utilization substance protein A